VQLLKNFPTFYGTQWFITVSFIQRIHPKPFVTSRNKHIFYGEELLAPCSTSKLEDYPLSAIHNCLFNIFAASIHIWRPSPPSAAWGRFMPWWQGTHLTWRCDNTSHYFQLDCSWCLTTFLQPLPLKVINEPLLLFSISLHRSTCNSQLEEFWCKSTIQKFTYCHSISFNFTSHCNQLHCRKNMHVYCIKIKWKI
jgi:hypothetical protein